MNRENHRRAPCECDPRSPTNERCGQQWMRCRARIDHVFAVAEHAGIDWFKLKDKHHDAYFDTKNAVRDITEGR